MAISLGVDTGGTYTDAVLIRDETDILASAKALTTREELAVGIGNAVRTVIADSGVSPDQIGLASLSTTLATNALVEGQGERVALVFIGFRARDLEAHGLLDALKGDPHIVLAGGHTHAGSEAVPLDEAALVAFLETHKQDVSGFAVASQFATRNPAHELRTAALVSEITGRPVSCSHQLSAKLNGPKRAVTAVLNARLIGMIDRLITRAVGCLRDNGIEAPMMVVRGDGALISADQARTPPIETILSGPAASIVGARWLTGAEMALVSDIGGTTTDVAVLRGGRPKIDPAGAQVGPYRTMVEAVAMRTTGLGGDSEVHFISEGLQGGVLLGPRRLMPVSLLAVSAPDVVHTALDAQLRSTTPGEHDCRFVRRIPGQREEGLSPRETEVLDRIGLDIHPVAGVLCNRMDGGALKKLWSRGLVQIAGVTPSDAAHVLDRVREWDTGAARKALELFGRRRTGSGMVLSTSARDVAQIIVDRLTHQTVLALLEAAFAEEEVPFEGTPAALAQHALMQRGLGGHDGLVRIHAGLHVPVVGLGASAACYYPAVGERLGTEMILPQFAGVANAIGAVVGRITMRRSGTITAPSDGIFRVHLDTGPQDFAERGAAFEALEATLRAQSEAEARTAGAEDVHVTVAQDIRLASVEAREVFVEATMTVEASGRPRVAG